MPKDYANGEFQIIHGEPSEAQKKLNQWKHQYLIEVISMDQENSLTTILVHRIKK